MYEVQIRDAEIDLLTVHTWLYKNFGDSWNWRCSYEKIANERSTGIYAFESLELATLFKLRFG